MELVKANTGVVQRLKEHAALSRAVAKKFFADLVKQSRLDLEVDFDTAFGASVAGVAVPAVVTDLKRLGWEVVKQGKERVLLEKAGAWRLHVSKLPNGTFISPEFVDDGSPRKTMFE